MPPKFLYFDLGKVLLDFSVDEMCRRMGDVAGVAPQRVREVVFATGLQAQYERGAMTSRQFYEAFCRETGSTADYDALTRAAADIFTVHLPMMPVVAHLCQAGHRMGILSNTCEIHWQWCIGRFRLLQDCFSIYALSYQIGACKPEEAIFRAAAAMAGCPPEKIFYTDDVPGHVAGAQAVGFDAVAYRSAGQIAEELRRRGVAFNY